jgi:glycyl-tRNA synthetase beta subunit
MTTETAPPKTLVDDLLDRFVEWMRPAHDRVGVPAAGLVVQKTDLREAAARLLAEHQAILDKDAAAVLGAAHRAAQADLAQVQEQVKKAQADLATAKAEQDKVTAKIAAAKRQAEALGGGTGGGVSPNAPDAKPFDPKQAATNPDADAF